MLVSNKPYTLAPTNERTDRPITFFSLVAFSDKTQYKYFFRTIPTQVIVADVMLAFAAQEGWSKVGIIYTDDPLGQQCEFY